MQTVTLPPIGTRGIVALTTIAVVSVSFLFLLWYVLRNDRGDR